MKQIFLDGIVGLDFDAASVRQQIAAARGDSLEFVIDSPGGSVTAGIALYNTIRSAPGAKTSRVIGLAASMASYVMLAADRIIVEPNSVVMVHEPAGGALGTEDDMRKFADVLAGFAGILAQAYAAQMGRSVDEVRALMRSESWYFGSEIVDIGLADEVAGGSATEAKSAAIARSRGQFSAVAARLRSAGRREDVAQIAACLTASMAGMGSTQDHRTAAEIDRDNAIAASSAARASARAPGEPRAATAAEAAAFARMNFSPTDIREYLERN